MSAPQSHPVITDVFVEGARKGWSIATGSTLPTWSWLLSSSRRWKLPGH